MLRKPRPKTRNTTLKPAESSVFDRIRIGSGRSARKLRREEISDLLQFLAARGGETYDPFELAPRGSFLARMLRHFEDTDISHTLPIAQVVMLAASHLTQIGARLVVPGLTDVLPSLWTVVLADSGSSKTLSKDEVFRVASPGPGISPVTMIPAAGSDAQWIAEVARHNGGYWFQDEVGKCFDLILRDQNFRRMKHWMLDAYSHQPISNNLKTGVSTTVPLPHFTFLGLAVSDTWSSEISLSSLLDGFCQRFNYFIAPPRPDTDLYDHFLYFAGEKAIASRAALHEQWQALCAQPGAAGPYHLTKDVIPWLEQWWLNLRRSWGNTPVPASFIRRIGFSVLRYLPVIHFLLGKSRWPVDVETTEIATRFAEVHFHSTLEMLKRYDPATAGAVRKIASLHEDLKAAGKRATAREISQRLSKQQRASI